MIHTQTNFKAVANHAFITLPGATQQGYERESGIYVPPPPKRQEEAAAVIGTVVSVPERLFIVRHIENAEVRIGIELKEGDKVAVNYMVTSKGYQTEGGFVHENAWLINGELVWLTAPDNLIAVYRNGDWQALGDHVLIKAIEEPKYQTELLLPDIATAQVGGRGTLVSGSIGVPRGTIVIFDPSRAATYQFADGEEYMVVGANFVFGFIS